LWFVVFLTYFFDFHSFPTDSVFPQGCQAAWAVMIAIPTLCLMAAGMGGCNYVRINDDQLGWGLIWREETVLEDELTSRRIQCTSFDDLQTDRFDAIWKLGMFFAYTAIIIVSISSIAALALACATYSKRWKNVLTACFVVGAMCQVLTFVVLASDICEENEDCTLSFGAGITIGGIAFSLLAAATTYSLIPPSHVRNKVAIAASRREEDEHAEHADSVTEDDTHGAAADPETGLDRDTDAVEETEGVFVQEEGEGEEKEETQDLNPFTAKGDEESNPSAEADDDDDSDDPMKPVIDIDDENLSDVPLTEEDVEAIIDEGRDEAGVEYDKAEGFGKKKLPEI
jgi:hypothetical protein